MFEQKFAFSLVFFVFMRQFHFDFYTFFRFFGLDFLYGFLGTKFQILASGFLFTCGILTLIFCFFLNLLVCIFFGNGFPNSLIVLSRSSVCLVNGKILNCFSGFVLLYFLKLFAQIFKTLIFRNGTLIFVNR